ncbi:MAG: baseplate J/gp47 family protein, partial [Lachnospiraceae bacterium]|nr:baseplate J/gp47 family protein [Lachnospiraceae bacterium]
TELRLWSNQKFWLGDVCFETNRPLHLSPCRLTEIFGFREEKRYDFPYLLEKDVKVPVWVFGKAPARGDSLWFCSDGLPKAGTEMIFYFQAMENLHRNPFEEKKNNPFADIRWECYTKEGFVPMHVKDDTAGFLVSGEVRLRLPHSEAVPCPLVAGNCYVIRAVLDRAEYDVPPELLNVSGFLFEAWQKDTQAICHTFNRISRITLKSSLLKQGYITVFGKEEKGSSYRKYTRGSVIPRQGRYYDLKEEEDGSLTWSFDQEKYGYAPQKLKNPVKIVAYSEQIMRRYDLGKVLGLDDQVIDLPMNHVVPESFCIITERLDDQGVELYDFVRPGRYGEDDLTYDLFEDEGKLVIRDGGRFIGARLYIGAYSTNRGEEGNIREGNVLLGEETGDVVFYNPGPGTGGCFQENPEQVKQRFLKDLETPYTAVTAGDYERLVKELPGLCIHKVRAFMDEAHNTVRVAVKPAVLEPFPELSEHYRKIIGNYLEQRRLLTTRIEITGPVYVKVDVQGTVYIKRHSENSLQMIEQTIRDAVDCVESEKRFGEAIRFDQVFHRVEELDCVEFVYELSLKPRNPALARLVDSDVFPAENCLCHAGDVQIETVTGRG